MIGERTESQHYRRVAGGVEITGPAVDGTLEGNPVADQHLAVIAGTNAGESLFAVTIAANWGSFIVTDAEAGPGPDGSNTPSDNKRAILNALIYKNVAKDGLGRPLLARATMKRLAPRTPSPA